MAVGDHETGRLKRDLKSTKQRKRRFKGKVIIQRLDGVIRHRK